MGRGLPGGRAVRRCLYLESRPPRATLTMDGVPRLFLIDSFGFIFRAYHARARSGAPPMRTSAGMQTEAVYIFHNMVRRLQSVHKPEYLAAIFESLGPTFRDAAFAAYKANRTETPPDLLEQIPWIRKTLEGHAHSGAGVRRLRGGRRDRNAGVPGRGAGRRGGHRFERQGHAATGQRPRAHDESDEGRPVVRRRGDREIHGRAAGAGGGSAGAEGRQRPTIFRARRGSARRARRI